MKENKIFAIASVLKKFQTGGGDFFYQPFGSGHINDTFLVQSKAPASPDYLLQRINHQVFPDVEALMDNLWQVTNHIRQKLATPEGLRSNFITTTIIPACNGKLYYQDPEGSYWRLQTFIPHSISYDVVRSEAQAYQAGIAFGKFQALLYDLPEEKLTATIPDFHNMESRLKKFLHTLDADPTSRKVFVEKEVNFVSERQQQMLDMYGLIQRGELPCRITHNDTKFNNVLLDKVTQEAVCVIDLDTVMPGVVHYDFGDAVRTITNTAEEDEKNLHKIQVNMGYFEAFARGYFQEAGFFLTDAEIAYLPFSSHYMTFIMGLRFLTDYLAGDVYYKIRHPEHNLQRARAQFQLLRRMEEQHSLMQDMVRQLALKSPAPKGVRS